MTRQTDNDNESAPVLVGYIVETLGSICATMDHFFPIFELSTIFSSYKGSDFKATIEFVFYRTVPALSLESSKCASCDQGAQVPGFKLVVLLPLP